MGKVTVRHNGKSAVNKEMWELAKSIVAPNLSQCRSRIDHHPQVQALIQAQYQKLMGKPS